MRSLCIVLAVIGAIIAAVDTTYLYSHGHRLGFEQVLELLLLAIIAALVQLWPPAPRDREEGISATRGP
jgi:hypothetical protein